MNPTAKKNIDVFVPLGIALFVGYRSYKANGKDVQRVAILTIVVYLLALFIVPKVTKAIAAEKAKPDTLPVPAEPGTGGGTGAGAGFNAKAYTDDLHQDINEIFGFRNSALYGTVAGLTDAQLVQIYNDWNARYFHEDSETLIAAMRGEWYTGTTKINANNIINRLIAQGAN